MVGEAALPQLHDALAAVDTEDRHKFQIVNVIGEIGSVSSAAPLIEAAEARADGGFYRPVLFALALIPPTTESVAFANAQLAVGVTERRQVAGLVYLAQIRHAPAADLVAQFTDDALSPRLRSAGLYLGARLGVQGTAAAIEAALQQATERSDLETLLTSLGEAAASPEEFTRVASAAGFTERSFSYRQQLAYCAFRTAADDRKAKLAYEVAPAERKRLTRVAKRLEALGYLERITELNRDRATHVRPTYSALAWVIDMASESVNLAELSEGLSRCEWADDLGRQLRAGDRTQQFPAAVAERFTGEDRDA